MAKVVAVHGIGQQFKGGAIIHREWWPAFVSGLRIAGHDLENDRDFVCPFYGHLFRPPGALSTADVWRTKDISEDQGDLLKLLWAEAENAEPHIVPSPDEYDAEMSLARAPQLLQRALSALARSSFLANISQGALIGDLKQVVSYMNDSDIRGEILEIVLREITTDTKLVIGHSLGSVIAYEALCLKSANVVGFISLGSPLGIRNLIFDRLTPKPSPAGVGIWPGTVRQWTNIADAGDIVASIKDLATRFGNQVKDILVYNGSDAHHGERYLTTKEAGYAAVRALWETNA